MSRLRRAVTCRSATDHISVISTPINPTDARPSTSRNQNQNQNQSQSPNPVANAHRDTLASPTSHHQTMSASVSADAISAGRTRSGDILLPREVRASTTEEGPLGVVAIGRSTARVNLGAIQIDERNEETRVLARRVKIGLAGDRQGKGRLTEVGKAGVGRFSRLARKLPVQWKCKGKETWTSGWRSLSQRIPRRPARTRIEARKRKRISGMINL